MKARKVIAMGMIAAMSVGMLAGCGGDKKDDKKEDGGKKKLTISTWDNDTSPQFKTAVEVFKEKHPDVEIEYVDTAANEYNNKLTVMLAGGDPDPDVIFVKDMGTQISMQEKGQIECLDKYIEKYKLDLSITELRKSFRLKENSIHFHIVLTGTCCTTTKICLTKQMFLIQATT